VDLSTVQQRVGLVETVLSSSVGPAADRHREQCVHELDRLAESLVGEPAAEAKEVKTRIQLLLTRAAPQRSDAMVYIEVYCRGFRA
jgi:hypothetical protein